MRGSVWGWLLCFLLVWPRLAAGSEEAPDRLLVATGEWPPFISSEVDNFGPLSERVADIFRDMGYEIEIQVVPWKRAYELTMKGYYPASFAWFWTEKRAGELLVPDQPLQAFDHSVFYSQARYPDGLDGEFSSLADLASSPYRIVGINGYWYVSEFEKLGAALHLAPNVESAFRLLRAGRYDIFLENREVGFWEIRKGLGPSAEPEFRTTGSVPAGDLYVMFSPAHPRGRDLLDAYNAQTGEAH